MKFLFPEAFWALTALSLPLIIHLFSFRTTRKVYFSDIRWLKTLQEQTRKRSQLKHWLVLTMRMLAFIALIFAFAQPYWPNKHIQQPGASATSIYIDNSVSMSMETDQANALEAAKEAAAAIAAKARPDDRFQLILQQSLPGEMRSLNAEQLKDQLTSIQPVQSARLLSVIAARQREWLDRQQLPAKAIWLSDFQRGNQDFSAIQPDTNSQISFFQLPVATASNLFIDTAWLASPILLPGMPARLYYRLVNSGNVDREAIRIALKINDVQKGLSTVSIQANLRRVDTLDFTITDAGWQNAVIQVDDQWVSFDDNYYLSFEIQPHIKVLVVSQETTHPALLALLKNDPLLSVDFVRLNQLDYSKIPQYKAILIDALTEMPSGLLDALTKSDANLLLWPSPNKVDAVNKIRQNWGLSPLLAKLQKVDLRVDYLAVADELFAETFAKIPENPDLPLVKAYYSAQSQQASLPLMRLNNGEPLVSSTLLNGRRLIQFYAPLGDEYSNLAQHALFVPLVYRPLLLGAGVGPLAFRLGEGAYARVNSNLPFNELYVLTDGKQRILPEFRKTNQGLRISLDALETSGWYALKSPDNDTSWHWIAVNSQSTESVMAFMDAQELENAANRLGARQFTLENSQLAPVFLQAAQSNPLWKWFLLAVLVFLLGETLLLKYLK